MLLEAMAYGLPLAVSDIPATHLVQLPAEAYFQKANADALAKCVAREWNKKHDTTTYDLSEFDWNAITRKTQSVILSVAKKSH